MGECVIMRMTFKDICKKASEGNGLAMEEMKNRIVLAKNGDDIVTLDIIAACEGFIKKFAYQSVKRCNISTFEDLCSLGTIGVLNAIKKYDLTKNIIFTTFVYREIQGSITTATYLERNRSYKKDLYLVTGCQDQLPPQTFPEESLLDEESDTFRDVINAFNHEVLYNAFEKISEKQAESLMRRYVLDESPEEIAKELGVSVSSINNRIYFGKQALKKVLSKDVLLNY